ncbi:MAG: hypothetical protein H6757_00585 [Candidatus Omnitrophica bacterium]|nr:hypothetical protein [Candidatus Omnitrophota bacterium]
MKNRLVIFTILFLMMNASITALDCGCAYAFMARDQIQKTETMPCHSDQSPSHPENECCPGCRLAKQMIKSEPRLCRLRINRFRFLQKTLV